MSNITRYTAIGPAALREEDYLRTLFVAAASAGALDQTDVTRIADQLLQLLAAEAARFTQGTSTSLPTEQVDQLYASICYTIGLVLQTLPPEDAGRAPETGTHEGDFPRRARHSRPENPCCYSIYAHSARVDGAG